MYIFFQKVLISSLPITAFKLLPHFVYTILIFHFEFLPQFQFWLNCFPTQEVGNLQEYTPLGLTNCFKGAFDNYNICLFIFHSMEDFQLNQYQKFQLILPMHFHFMRYFVNSIIYRASHKHRLL